VDRGDDGGMTSEADTALACMWVLVDELVRGGMSDACVSPGSRSTPIALALSRHPGVRVHVHLDERASAFFALGLSKATGRVVAVACTSGTAAANFLPAVVEASMSRVPLLLLTADRPPELRGVGANQTIDQLELYGKHAKWFVDAAVPGDRAAEETWRSLGRLALDAAGSHPPGPAHLNLPFREPLVPSENSVRRAAPEVGAVMPGPSPALEPTADEIDALVEAVEATARGVIVAGSLREDASAVLDVARRAGWPLVAEPMSGLRVPGALTGGQFLLATEAFAGSHAPDIAVQFGAAPTSRAGLALVANAKRLVIVDPDWLVADPARHASWTIEADAGTLANAVAARIGERGGTEWLREWLEADTTARRAVDGLVDSWEEPFEGRMARDLAASLPDGSTLVVGSSMPVRDLDVYMVPRTGLRVLANRGASGIDGFVSTVLGVAASGAPTYALMGDLTLLHDVGGLMWSARHGLDAVLVVVNNGGGGVFSFLAQREVPELEELFTTPHGRDLAKVCEAAGAGHQRIERASDLVPAVGRAAASGGVRIVEVVVDRELNVTRHAGVNAAVATALAHGVRS